MRTKFKCKSCGACCRNVKAMLDMDASSLGHSVVDALKSFPYSTTAEGHCEKLTADNKCAVYKDRPLICRVDDVFKIQNKIASLNEWQNINAQNCIRLNENHNPK